MRDVISIPLVANGDGDTPDDAKAMLQQSGADAVMLGRAAYGRPWWPGAVAEALKPGSGKPEPSLAEERDLALWHQDETLLLYGASLGNKTFRKHLGWLLTRLHERQLLNLETLAGLRSRLLSNPDNAAVQQGILEAFAMAESPRQEVA